MINIEKDSNNAYRFQLKNSDGTTILSSVPFSDEKKVKQVVSELNPLVQKRSVFERKTDYDGKFLFNLKNKDGQVIGNSPLYESEAGMENGIKHVKNRIEAMGTSLTIEINFL